MTQLPNNQSTQSSITLTVNGDPVTTTAPFLSILLQDHAITQDSTGVAVALNSTLVTKDVWNKTALKQGDTIDIVKPFAGGN